MDESAMEKFPTKTEYAALDKADDPNKPVIDLYEATKNMVAIVTLGQGSDHGLVVIKKTNSPDHPIGLIYKSIAMLMKKKKAQECKC